jgi:hypothetical protein
VTEKKCREIWPLLPHRWYQVGWGWPATLVDVTTILHLSTIAECAHSTTSPQVGIPKTLEVDMVIGADGANSRVAKDIDAGEYDYAIAFQVRPPVGNHRWRPPVCHSCIRTIRPCGCGASRSRWDLRLPYERRAHAPCAVRGVVLRHAPLCRREPHHLLLSLVPPLFPQERIRISDEKMKYYENLAEMYVGDDVSPDFYGWVSYRDIFARTIFTSSNDTPPPATAAIRAGIAAALCQPHAVSVPRLH